MEPRSGGMETETDVKRKELYKKNFPAFRLSCVLRCSLGVSLDPDSCTLLLRLQNRCGCPAVVHKSSLELGMPTAVYMTSPPL